MKLLFTAVIDAPDVTEAEWERMDGMKALTIQGRRLGNIELDGFSFRVLTPEQADLFLSEADGSIS